MYTSNSFTNFMILCEFIRNFECVFSKVLLVCSILLTQLPSCVKDCDYIDKVTDISTS